MEFYSSEHIALIEKVDTLWRNLHDLAELAHEYGIDDIFQDNGAKVLQQLIYLNMQIIPGREGNDAISPKGYEWEMKSINLATSATGFSTNHHTNQIIIDKYRQVPWSFAIYRNLNLEEIYVMSPSMLEPLFSVWENKLKTMSHINNPKIPVRYVRSHGVKIYPFDSDNPIDPESVIES